MQSAVMAVKAVATGPLVAPVSTVRQRQGDECFTVHDRAASRRRVHAMPLRLTCGWHPF